MISFKIFRLTSQLCYTYDRETAKNIRIIWKYKNSCLEFDTDIQFYFDSR